MKKSADEYLECRRRMARESQARRRAKAKDAGMCQICCRNRPAEGLTTCPECIQRIIDYHKRKKEELTS